MPTEKTKLTLDDIAVHAGVSVSTVSRVINNSNTVSQDLAARVKQAIKELGFEPGLKPRSKPYIIAFFAWSPEDPTAAAVIAGAHNEATRLGLCVVVMNMAEEPGYATQNLELLKHLSFDGLIIDDSNLDPEKLVRDYKLSHMPIAVITPFTDSPRFYCISADFENGMYQAARYLLNLNHKKIAYITWAPKLEISLSRLRGIQRAFAEEGLQFSEEYNCNGLASINSGFETTMSILNRSGKQHPTAIIAYNDLIAVGAMHAIRTYGLSVPEDISVIGFNEMYFTPHTNPPMTTVSQPAYRKGQLAIPKIYHHLHGHTGDIDGYTLLECRLVVRGSTAPCKTK